MCAVHETGTWGPAGSAHARVAWGGPPQLLAADTPGRQSKGRANTFSSRNPEQRPPRYQRQTAFDSQRSMRRSHAPPPPLLLLPVLPPSACCPVTPGRRGSVSPTTARPCPVVAPSRTAAVQQTPLPASTSLSVRVATAALPSKRRRAVSLVNSAPVIRPRRTRDLACPNSPISLVALRAGAPRTRTRTCTHTLARRHATETDSNEG